MEDKAYTHIFYDIYNKVLQLSENPSQFAEYLALQIRELIGTRAVVIAIKAETGPTEIFSVYPERKKKWANQNEVIKLAEHSFHYATVQYLDKEKCENECSSLLAYLEIEKVIAIPLIVANQKIGSVLLLDIMDNFGIDSVINLLEQLSGVFALVIRNARLFHEMENLVALRTAELQEQNRMLLQSEQELQLLNEEYQVINEELSETLIKADRINKELVEANLRAEKSELQAREILQTAMDGFWIIDLEGRFKDVNEVACNMLGYKREELLKMSMADIDYSEKGETVKQRIKKIKKTGKDRFETKHRCKNGNIIDVEISVVLQSTQNLLVVFVHDITERKKAVTAIKESEERYRNVIDISPDGIIVHCEGKIVLTNNAAVQAVGASGLNDLLGKSALEFVHPDDRAIALNRIANLLQTGIPASPFEERMIKMDGSVIDVEVAAVRTNFKGKLASLVVLRDITERKLAEKALKESNERFQLAMMASNDGLFDWNLETNEIYYSPGWKKMLGYEDHELPNDFSIWTNLTDPEDVKNSWKLQQKLISKEVDRFVIEIKMKHKNGYSVDILSRAEAIFNDGGKAIRIIGTHSDITKRKKAEDALRKNEAVQSKMVANIGDVIVIIDSDGINRYKSPNITKLFGWRPDELIGKSTWDVVHPDDLNYVQRVFSHLLKEKNNTANLEFRYRCKDGNYKWIEFAGVNLNHDKDINGILGNYHDITERKQAEQQIIAVKEQTEASEKKYKDLVNSSQNLIWTCDLQGRFTFLNNAWEETHGYTISEMLGKPFSDFQRPEVFERDFKEFSKHIEGGFIKGYETSHIRKDGTEIALLFNAMPLSDIKGETIGTQGTAFDISKLKETQKELIAAKEKAEESDRLKSAFLANMSHEIRTPMNGILGFTELLLEPDLSSEQKEAYINIVNESGRRMLNTVNDIVEISKIEAGIVSVDLKEVNVQECLDKLIRFFIPEATKKGLKLILEKEVSLVNSVITTDHNKLDSILTNLIKNAIKYTPSGEIKVGCKEKENMLEFFVTDTGIGIAEERQQSVFERFIQADIVDKDARQGSGLGLAITKAYVEMLGGEIGVKSKPGQGSRFYFTLPFGGQIQKISGENRTTKGDVGNNLLKGLNIVIAEDDANSVIYLQTILKNESSKIIVTTKGQETVDVCRDNPGVDLVLMDIQMPGMDGYEATRLIREFNKDVVIIAQTAYALSGDRDKAIDAGCNDYISKPVKKEELHKLIDKYFNS